MPWMHALRDGLILLATLALWRWDRSGLTGAAATLVGLATGFATAVCGYLVHEWGHLLGARLSVSVVHLPSRVNSLFLFNFDSDRNSRGQFLCMSFGGFIASGLALTVFVTCLPLDALSGRLALGLACLGLLATAVLEFPPAWRVARGGPIPRGLAYHSEAS